MDGLNYNAPGPKVYNATLKMVDALISDESNTNQATNEFKLIKSYLEENKKQIIEELSEDNIN